MKKILLKKGRIYLSPHAEAVEIQPSQLLCQSNTEKIKPGTETNWVMGEGFFDGLLL